MFGSTSIIVRFSATIAAIGIIAAVLTAGLNYLKFKKAIGGLEASRYAFVVGDLDKTIEQSLNLGLPLATLHNTQDLIDRRRAQDPYISSITVYDDKQHRLFDTDRHAPGGIPETWLGAMTGLDDWVGEDADAFIVGTSVSNNFGQKVGGVALRYSKKLSDAETRAIFIGLSQSLLIAWAFASGIAVIGVCLVLYRTRRRLSAVTQSLHEAILSNVGAAKEVEPSGDPDPAFASFETATRASLKDLRTAEIEVEKIGQAA